MAGNERPAKRVKLGGQSAPGSSEFAQENPSPTAAFDAFAGAPSQAWNVPAMFDDGWKWDSTSPLPEDPNMFLPMGPMNPVDSMWPLTQTSQIGPYSGPPLSELSQGNLSVNNTQSTISQPPPARRVAQSARRTGNQAVESASPDHKRRKSRTKTGFVSPFRDCIDTFGTIPGPRYFRPMDGKVNGYIKFNWPKGEAAKNSRRVVDVTEEDTKQNAKFGDGGDAYYRHPSISSDASSSSSSGNPGPSPPSTALTSGSKRKFSTSSPSLESSSTLVYSPVASYQSAYMLSPPSRVNAFARIMLERPSYVPPGFGHTTPALENMDRKFFHFYLNNWCPGRSVLKNTNLWLTDFAKMQSRQSILSAIQSLAGIYIYDYQPAEVVRLRVNKHFNDAEARLSHLLERASSLESSEATELITLCSILSMQDIVLTERRLKRPYNPRWLQGFKHAEVFLQVTDPGNRFWKSTNVQLDSLRISQAVIVGRAVILAQPMMPLPSSASFDLPVESARFGWLLYGTPKDMHEIHGGCGFSKRLLHIFSQITCCSARLLQDPESPVVPQTAECLLDVLVGLRQWSGESTAWEDAKDKPPPVSWVRAVPDNYEIQASEEMTDVTAEAWRVAGLLYLQCRLMRLPRNDPAVLCNLGDLAKIISIMPTSGYVFTAQAPLLPVFFLGLLSTLPEHKAVAIAWFEQVIHIPVRSSVPPLYDALKRILSWLPNEIELPLPTNMELAPAIAKRQPWWERMVSKVQEREPEILCLT